MLPSRKHCRAERPGPTSNTQTERGSAVLVVFILLTVMASTALNNNRVLLNLKQEIDLVGRRQVEQARRSGQF
ncbi:MAG: hypothetical protein M1608_18365 [Candidatus Omnitrophica bacterium]|nr:hypothetical protein [Candidatus Omnitrophota bacterium]